MQAKDWTVLLLLNFNFSCFTICFFKKRKRKHPYKVLKLRFSLCWLQQKFFYEKKKPKENKVFLFCNFCPTINLFADKILTVIELEWFFVAVFFINGKVYKVTPIFEYVLYVVYKRIFFCIIQDFVWFNCIFIKIEYYRITTQRKVSII